MEIHSGFPKRFSC